MVIRTDVDPTDIDRSLKLAVRSAGYDIGTLELLRIGNNYVYADRAGRRIFRVSVRERDRGDIESENRTVVELAAQNAPILPPVQIEPLVLDTGHLATVWPLGESPEPNPVISLAPILAELHRVAPLPAMPRWAGFERGYYRVGTARDTGVPVDLINEVESRLDDLASVFPEWSKTTVVHGDPHTGNLVQLEDRHLLIDLDDLAVGCPEIDLAPLCTSYRRFDGVPGIWQDYLTSYGQPVDLDLLDWFVRLRQLTMLAWLFTLWDFRPESRDEAAHRVRTLDKVAKWNPL